MGRAQGREDGPSLASGADRARWVAAGDCRWTGQPMPETVHPPDSRPRGRQSCPALVVRLPRLPTAMRAPLAHPPSMDVRVPRVRQRDLRQPAAHPSTAAGGTTAAVSGALGSGGLVNTRMVLCYRIQPVHHRHEAPIAWPTRDASRAIMGRRRRGRPRSSGPDPAICSMKLARSRTCRSRAQCSSTFFWKDGSDIQSGDDGNTASLVQRILRLDPIGNGAALHRHPPTNACNSPATGHRAICLSSFVALSKRGSAWGGSRCG